MATDVPTSVTPEWRTYRRTIGRASLLCVVNGVHFFYELAYQGDTDGKPEDQKIAERYKLRFSGVIEHQFYRPQLNGKRIEINFSPNEKMNSWFRLDDMEPVIGVLEYFPNSGSDDLVSVCIDALPNYFSRIEAMAKQVLEYPSGESRIEIGVIDMWENWKPEENDRPALWISSINFNLRFDAARRSE